MFNDDLDSVPARLAVVRDDVVREQPGRIRRRRPRRATVDELAAANAEARELLNQILTASRVLRGQLARYEQLVQVDSWHASVAVALPDSVPDVPDVPDDYFCPHRRGLDGRCAYGSACQTWSRG